MAALASFFVAARELRDRSFGFLERNAPGREAAAFMAGRG
jgi:hypothetical protein